jgi:hypothetical protein
MEAYLPLIGITCHVHVNARLTKITPFRSSSMGDRDRRPSPGIPSTATIAAHSNNRLGAVYSALHSFWMARQTAINNAGGCGARRDAYSVLLYHDHATRTSIINNFSSTPDQLLQELLPRSVRYGTNVEAAVTLAQDMMQTHWNAERSARGGCKAVAYAYHETRSPILVLLSDGECSVPQTKMYDICRGAVTLG